MLVPLLEIETCPELSSLLVNMKADAQAAVAAPLRSAIWNWIDTFPDEYHDSLQSRGRLEGMPERVYDLLFNVKDVDNVAVIWPTLTALMCASSVETSGAEFSLNSVGIPKTAQRPKVGISKLVPFPSRLLCSRVRIEILLIC
jgi:neurofibromin 1